MPFDPTQVVIAAQQVVSTPTVKAILTGAGVFFGYLGLIYLGLRFEIVKRILAADKESYMKETPPPTPKKP